MLNKQWWEDLKCSYDDRKICLEIGLCENCEYYPANSSKYETKSSQLDAKQITIEDILDEK